MTVDVNPGSISVQTYPHLYSFGLGHQPFHSPLDKKTHWLNSGFSVQQDRMADPYGSRTAPFYHVPSRRIVSVEHPAIIRNLDKAVDTLKGDAGITKVR